jgi:hypothetical protein
VSDRPTQAGKLFTEEMLAICKLPEPERTQQMKALQARISAHYRPKGKGKA